MSSAVGGVALQGAQWEMLVAKKGLEAAQVEGKQSLELIEAAEAPAPSANVAPTVGQRLDIVA